MRILPQKFNQHHITTRVEWINDIRINQSMFFDLPATIENTIKWYNAIKTNSTRLDFTFLNNEGIIIAMGGFTGINSIHKNAEFYVMVNPELQGKGIGRLVSIWMYNFGFSRLELNKIYLYTNDDNVAAYSIYEKAGFSLEGLLREHKWKNNKFQNRRFYGLLKSDWNNLPWKKNIEDEI